MSFITDLMESVRLNRLVGATEEQVKNAFFANYLAGLLLLRLQDMKGLLLINDRQHTLLNRFSDQMSDINFWGMALFHPEKAEVKSRMMAKHADILAAEAGRVMSSRVHFLMLVPTTDPDKIRWEEVTASLVLLKSRFGIQSSYYRNILYYLHNWDTSSQGDKKRAVNQAFMYLLQSDPKSALMPRMRELGTGLLVKGLTAISQKLVGFKRITETEGGDSTSVGNIASWSGGANAIIRPPGTEVGKAPSSSTNLDNIYSFGKKKKDGKKGKYVFRDNKIIKKKKQKFKSQKFKAPDWMKRGASYYGIDHGHYDNEDSGDSGAE